MPAQVGDIRRVTVLSEGRTVVLRTGFTGPAGASPSGDVDGGSLDGSGTGPDVDGGVL